MKNLNETVQEEFISGSGGKGGGGAAPFEADDTLSALQTITSLIAIGEGPIDSVSEVYLNNNPASSYKRVQVGSSLGFEVQDIIKGFSQVESPHPTSSNLPLLKDTPVVLTVTNGDVDALRLTLGLNTLFLLDEKNNILGSEVSFDIYTRKNSSDLWTKIFTRTKIGKTRNPYAWNIRVPKPNGATTSDLWQVKIIRITPDDDIYNKTSSKASWISTIEIQEANPSVDLSYPNTALIGVTLSNAVRLGGSIPTISARVKGLKLKVPGSSVYNASTQVYSSSVWDGSWNLALQYTDSPGWILYNILTNARWGLGIDEAKVDKFAFFKLAYYCAELVDNGLGVMERRFTFNNQFMNREGVMTFLMYIETICNSKLIYDNFGNLSVTYDHSEQASFIIGNNEVIDGLFNYTSSLAEDRYTQVNVTWNNPDLLGATDTETWPKDYPSGSMEESMLNRYGLQSTDIVLAGCYSRRQAIAKARWVFYTSCLCTNILNFKTLLYGLTFKIGQVFGVIDNDNINVVRTSKLKSYVFAGTNHLTLTLDSYIDLPASAFTVTYRSGTGFVEYPILETAITTNTLTISSISPVATPFPNTDTYLVGDVVPTLWKISEISVDSETQEHTITAIEHDNNKFTYVDNDIFLDSPNYYGFPATSVTPVESISVIKDFHDDGIKTSVNLTVKWIWFENSAIKSLYLDEHAAWITSGMLGNEPVPKNPNPCAFKVTYRRNNSNYTELPTVYSFSAIIPDALLGTYDITVNAVTANGIESIDTIYTYVYGNGVPSTLVPPTNVYVEGTTGTVFTDEAARIVFSYDTTNDTKEDKLLRYVLEIWDVSGASLKHTYYVTPLADKGGLFVYTFANNSSDFSPANREFMFKIYSQDLDLNLSTSIDTTFSNPAPESISISVEMGADTATISLPILSGDSKGFLIHMNTADGFIPGDGNKVYDGSDSKATIYLPANGIYYFKAAEYDVFGQDVLNYSAQIAGTAVGLNGGRIEANTLSRNSNYSITGDVNIIGGDLELLINTGYTCLQSPGTSIILSVSLGSSIPLATKKIKVALTNSSGVALGSFYFYDRSGQKIDQRSYFGTKTFSIVVPYDGIVNVFAYLFHDDTVTTTPLVYETYVANNPYLDIVEHRL